MNGFLTYPNMTDVSDIQGQVFNSMQIEMLSFLNFQCLITQQIFDIFCILDSKVSNGAKIRNRYNQVPHLTQDTNGKVTNKLSEN